MERNIHPLADIGPGPVEITQAQWNEWPDDDKPNHVHVDGYCTRDPQGAVSITRVATTHGVIRMLNGECPHPHKGLYRHLVFHMPECPQGCGSLMTVNATPEGDPVEQAEHEWLLCLRCGITIVGRKPVIAP